jgi:hypothetical protein
LDEIGELPLTDAGAGAALARNRCITRAGGTREVPVDVRVICATHRDLVADVRDKRFREGLYYRIGAFVVKVPPLRERPADVALLSDLFAREFLATPIVLKPRPMTPKMTARGMASILPAVPGARRRSTVTVTSSALGVVETCGCPTRPRCASSDPLRRQRPPPRRRRA